MSKFNHHDDEHANHERWLISYADFITLMFAFFVVMFAASQADKKKMQTFSESVARALDEGRMGAKLRQLIGGAPGTAGTNEASPITGKKDEPPQGKMAELLPSMRRLTSELDQEIKDGKLQISLEARGLVISLKEAAFFPSGDDTITPAAYQIIGKVAAVIQKLPNPVRLEGHTDAVPISNGRFASNWHLSVARSIAMLELLTKRFALEQDRLAVVGYADTVPMDVNTTPEGRGRNRRVDVTVLNEAALLGEPTQSD